MILRQKKKKKKDINMTVKGRITDFVAEANYDGEEFKIEVHAREESDGTVSFSIDKGSSGNIGDIPNLIEALKKVHSTFT